MELSNTWVKAIMEIRLNAPAVTSAFLVFSFISTFVRYHPRRKYVVYPETKFRNKRGV